MKVMLCILDGCNPQDFENVINDNAKTERFLQELLGGFYAHSVTGFPTVTINEHATLMTGCYPDRHGIPGIAWFDKRLTNYVRYHPGLDWLSVLRNAKDFLADFVIGLNISHLSPKVNTIFEILHDKFSISFKEFIARGVWEFSETTITEALRVLGSKLIALRHDSRGLKKSFIRLLLFLFSIKRRVPRLSKRNFCELLTYECKTKWRGKSPDFLVYWKVGTDDKSHRYGPGSPQLRKEIQNGLDRASDAVDFYLQRGESVILFIVADHSQSKVNQVVSYSRIIKEKCRHVRIGNPHEISKLIGKDVIVVDNGRLSYIYILENNPNNYKKILHEIVAVLQEEDSVDLVFYKENGNMMVASGRGNTEVMLLADFPFNERKYPYDDPPYAGQPMYPDAVTRVEHILNSSNAGDIVISLNENWTTIPHKGDHGSLMAKDSLVPLLIHKFVLGERAANKPLELPLRKVDELQRNIDVAPTIARLFGETFYEADGKIIEEVIERYAKL